MNIIDLISDTHQRLRKEAYQRWIKAGNKAVSQSESHLMSKIVSGPLSLSDAARKMAISRQAAQKTALSLEEKGFLTYEKVSDNKKNKFLTLTEKGYDFIRCSETLKIQIEREIVDRVGADEIMALKDLLPRL
jgi:DNA-binding MarR family transcriptional regulator